ncbi:hypothetical protein, partial [Klebsiella pneumoniae]|uniref:hypothetical protein n=1 Tax=Klebsiella pneumoniae TaxID=573 RepID=UPI001D0E776F
KIYSHMVTLWGNYEGISQCKALFQMKQMGINRLRSKIGSSAKWGFHQHILLIHLVSPKRFFHARG